MDERTDKQGSNSGRKPGVVPERPKDLLAFWARTKRSRAVATCYTELWQERHKKRAAEILEFVRKHPGVDCKTTAKHFPDVYEAVIVALVLGPVRVSTESRHAASADADDEVNARPTEDEDANLEHVKTPVSDDEAVADLLGNKPKPGPNGTSNPPNGAIPW